MLKLNPTTHPQIHNLTNLLLFFPIITQSLKILPKAEKRIFSFPSPNLAAVLKITESKK